MKHSPTLSDEKEKAIVAMKKSLGTMMRVCEMIEADNYCPDIIQQLDAVEGLLLSVRKKLLKGHLRHCLADRVKKDEGKTISELEKILKLN